MQKVQVLCFLTIAILLGLSQGEASSLGTEQTDVITWAYIPSATAAGDINKPSDELDFDDRVVVGVGGLMTSILYDPVLSEGYAGDLTGYLWLIGQPPFTPTDRPAPTDAYEHSYPAVATKQDLLLEL